MRQVLRTDLEQALRHQGPQECVCVCMCQREGETRQVGLGHPISESLASGARTKGTPTFPAQKACGNGPRKAVQEDLVEGGMGQSPA